MAERNGTTMEVDLVFADVEDLHVRKSDDAESLVDLESIDSGQLDLGVLQSLGHSEGGGGGELGGVLLSISPAEDFANGLQVVLLDGGLGGEHEGGGAIGERRSVGGSDSSVLLESRAHSAGLALVELR